MGHVQDSGAVLIYRLFQHLSEFFFCPCIKGAEWLVKKKQFWPDHKAPCNGCSLLLSSAQGSRLSVKELTYSQDSGDLLYFRFDLLFVSELFSEGICYVFKNIHVGKKHMVLVHYAYLPHVRRKVGDIFSFQDNSPFFGPVKSYYGFKKQGFPATGRAYQSQVIAFLSLEPYPAEFEISYIKAEVPYLKKAHILPPSNFSKLRIARKAIPINKIPLVIAISRFP
ncbi:hypothetical protein DSECCO2_366260 [anaerobic digester metagenome]